MTSPGESGTGVRILSFDNGGPGSYAQLIFVKEYMGRVAADSGVAEQDVYPADYFDLMGGVGFGGLIATMLGHLRMNVEDATDWLIAIADAVFPEGSSDKLDREMNTKKLKEAMEEMLQARGIPLNTKMNDERRPALGCKVAVYATTAADLSHSRPFRTYSVRGSSLNPTIVEAICATMANPSFFLPTKIGPRLRQQSFVGGALGASNPTRDLLKEAEAVLGKDARLAQIISLGSGLGRLLSLEERDGPAEVDLLLKDMAVNCETVTRELGSRLFNVNAYLRLNVDRGMESVCMTDWSGLGAIESHTSAYLETRAVTQALESSLQRLRERVGTATLAQINHSSSIKVTAKTAPAVSPYYVARQKASDLMVHHLVTSPHSQRRIFPITGMGGCGKTQLVSYFLQEQSHLYKRVVFVDASSISSIKADLQAWAQSLGEGHEHDAWEDALRLLGNGGGSACSVLVYDNADDPNLDLVPFIPQNPNLSIIITSRNRNLGCLSTTYHLELGEMEDEEALKTMLQATRRQLPLSPEEMESATTLMRELGNLAVALVQVGTYCHELSSTIEGVIQPYTFTQYLSLFKSHRAELLKQVGPSSLDSYQRGAYTTLDLSYRAMPQVSKQVFHVLSFFHHTSIPVAALATAAKTGFLDTISYLPRPDGHTRVTSDLAAIFLVDGKWSELHVQEIIRGLRSFSLLSTTSADDAVFLQLHPLVQSWCRDMDTSSYQHYRAMAMQVMTACAGDANRIRLYRYLLPHVVDLVSQDQTLHINDLMAAGNILMDQGHHHTATGLFEAALEIVTNSNEGGEDDKNSIKMWLARAYWKQGRWIEAETLGLEVLGQRRRILGKDHPNTIIAASNLASTYWSQGRWIEAETLQLEVLEQSRRILGKDHPDTITVASNLASTYRDQGRWIEAETLGLEVIEQRRRILGKDHPDTITTASNLASTYRNQGRWIEAETLGLEVLEQSRRILGKDHPDTTTAASNLASTYWNQGRWIEAETLGLEVLEQSRRTLGKDHPDTITAASNLASTYRNQRRWIEAETLRLEVLEQSRRILGKDHPDTITAASNLASTYRNQGRWIEAETLQLEVLEQRRRILGKDHPDTIIAASNLASTYRSQGRWIEAETLQLEVLEQRRRIQGKDHPDIITAASNLVSAFWNQGRWIEAETLGLEVLEQSRRILGKDHPDIIRATSNLVSTYLNQGRWIEAGTLQLEVLEQSRRTLGKDHPDTIIAASNLASTYRNQGRWIEAETLQLEVLEQRQRIVGKDHPDTITAASNLASTYWNQGRWIEAETLQLEVLEQRRRIQGKDHLDTIIATLNLASTYLSQGKKLCFF